LNVLEEPPPMPRKTVHVMISGRVQGVGYRAWTERQALARGLSGWVRNRRNGSVEALFAGEAEVVDAMVAACRAGPPQARVNSVLTDELRGLGHVLD
jgi:acylphosphatase